MATNTGTVMTIANSIIGVSVLAMPFCFKQCGIILSIVMLILSSMLTRLTCYLLLKSAVMSRRRTFEYLAFHIFGPTGKFLTELCIIGYLMGTCIAFFVIVGDLGPEIISESLEITNSPALRPSFMIGLAILVILPLGLLRNVDSLSSVCIASIGFYFCLVLKVFFEALPHLVSGIWLEKVNYWRPAGVLQCLPIFSGALFCQMTLFEIYESLPNPSLERMNAAVHAAINMCTAFYISVGFLGYVAFCTESFGGNILLSFLPSVMSDLFKFGFVLSLAVSFPLVIFPCRVSLNSLIYRRIQGTQHESTAYIPDTRFKCLTSAIIAISLAVGLVIPNIELVLGLVGSTIGVAICVMFPALAFIFASGKRTADRATAQFLLGAGIVILVLGTYATLSARQEVKSAVTSVQQQVVQQQQVVERLEAAVAAAVKEEPVVIARREPPVPQEPVNVEKDPVLKEVPKEPIIKAVPKEPIIKTVPKESLQKEVDQVSAEVRKEPASVDKKDEVIHSDALRKEDEELAAAEKRESGDVERKNAELLRKIERNKLEQEQLLQEQKALILGLQKDRDKKDKKDITNDRDKDKVWKKEAAENEVDKESENVGRDKSAEKMQNRVEFKEAAVAKEEIESVAGNEAKAVAEGVIGKPMAGVGNSEGLVAVDDKVNSVPKPGATRDEARGGKPAAPVVVPLRNMTIKSIIMPPVPLVKKVPNPPEKVDSQRSPDLAKVLQAANEGLGPELRLEVAKVAAVDILKHDAAKIEDAKLGQRDILSAAAAEARQREKREADLAAKLETEAAENCAKTDKADALAENVEAVEAEPVAANLAGGNLDGVNLDTAHFVGGNMDAVNTNGEKPNAGDQNAANLEAPNAIDVNPIELKPPEASPDSLIKLSARLTNPLVADGDSIPQPQARLVDEAKPLSRDLKSVPHGNGTTGTEGRADAAEMR